MYANYEVSSKPETKSKYAKNPDTIIENVQKYKYLGAWLEQTGNQTRMKFRDQSE